jgi:hypothetical protein
MIKNKSRPLVLLVSGLLWMSIAHAQESVNASGGEALGIGGTVSYSVGQTLFTTHTGSEGSVSFGVQQSYEVSVVTGIEEAEGISLNMVAYPNPTSDILTLSTGNYQSEHLFYRVFAINGKLLEINRLNDGKALINMGQYPPAIYLVKVYDNLQEIKTFKIIKN